MRAAHLLTICVSATKCQMEITTWKYRAEFRYVS